MTDLLNAEEVDAAPDAPVAQVPVYRECLVARRPFNWHGRRFKKGEELDPVPTGQKRVTLARAGFIVAEVAGQPDVVAQVTAIRPDGLVCPDCAKVLTTPTGMKVHRTRVHGGS